MKPSHHTICLSTKEFLSFLRFAKLNTYAGDGKRVDLNFTRNYSINKDKWGYSDLYMGNLYDVGMEKVTYDNYPIWSLLYKGGIEKKNSAKSENIFNFLKSALLNCPKEMPTRGPEIYIVEEMTYINQWSGTIFDFNGKETIFFQDESIYQKSYFGGVILDKQYTINFTNKSCLTI